MRYFIGILIEKEPAWYYEAITQDLARNFDVRNLSEYIPPHLTLKPPFESEGTSEIENVIQNILSSQKEFPLHITGFGRYASFGDESRTIFLSVEAEKEDLEKIENTARSLATFGESKKSLSHPFSPHISIGRNLEPAQSKAVWNYLQTLPKPDFKTSFTNITLFRYEDGSWYPEKVFEVK